MNIKREGSVVILQIEADGVNGLFDFKLDCNSVWVAQLLYTAINKDHWRKQDAMKRDLYLQGYRDGRGRKAKKYG